MVQTVQLPNGDMADFPDEMGKEQIESIIQKQFPPAQEKVKTFLGEMPTPRPDMLHDESKIKEMINASIGGISPLGGAAGVFSPLLGKLANYPTMQSALRMANIPVTGAITGGASTPDNPLLGAALGGTIGAVPGAISGMKNLMGTVKSAFQKVLPSEASKSIQLFHDNALDQASGLFNQVSDVAKDRNIGLMKINQGLMNKIEKHLPDTRAAKNLIENAREGDYGALHKLQSEMWERASAKKSSVMPSDRDVAEEIFDLRDILNDHIIKHFKDVGHNDLSKKLIEAKDIYKNLKDTYYSHNVISKLVSPETRKIPKNLLSVLEEDSKQMKRLKNEVPMIDQILTRAAQKENALNQLKKMAKYGAYSGAAIGTIASIPYGYHKLTE